ncbi:hypothetical protein ABWH96_10565 [Marivirga tractuosa]|uniref:hypothetical protein n=1 Tax=Marivirga tractuosa TaxID=1006 RepID=UPI0035CFF0E4
MRKVLHSTFKKTDFDNFPPIGGLMVSKMVKVDRKKPLFMTNKKKEMIHEK